MARLTEAQRACLEYFRDNEINANRVQRPPYAWNRRQHNTALDRGWLEVGPGGWHILSSAGRDVFFVYDPADWAGDAQRFTDREEALEFYRDHPNRKSCRVVALNEAEGWCDPVTDDFDEELDNAAEAAWCAHQERLIEGGGPDDRHFRKSIAAAGRGHLVRP